jgi:hypothetical protein
MRTLSICHPGTCCAALWVYVLGTFTRHATYVIPVIKMDLLLEFIVHLVGKCDFIDTDMFTPCDLFIVSTANMDDCRDHQKHPKD